MPSDIIGRLLAATRRITQPRATPADPARFSRNDRVVSRMIRFGELTVPVFYRKGTTDEALPGMILTESSMYRLPQAVQPRVIFDVGANIGIASLYFALRYPHAHVYSFEPLPENLELLEANTQVCRQRIHICPFGLSDVAGSLTYHMSDNPNSFGGGTFCKVGHDPNKAIELPLKTVGQAMTMHRLDRVDVFKLDTEGSEHAVLRSIPPQVRQDAQAYIGELHGIDDWQACQLLCDSHDLGVDKRPGQRCFAFSAIRRDLLGRQLNESGDPGDPGEPGVRQAA